MKYTYWKLLSLLLALCMVFSTVACTQEPPVDDTKPPVEQPGDTPDGPEQPDVMNL